MSNVNTISTNEKLVTVLGEPVLSGIVADVAWEYGLGVKKDMPTRFGVQPVGRVVGLSQASGSLLAELIHSFVFAYIPQQEKWTSVATASLKVGLPALFVYLMLNFENPLAFQQLGGSKVLAVSLVSEALSSYMYENAIFPTLFGKSFDPADKEISFA